MKYVKGMNVQKSCINTQRDRVGEGEQETLMEDIVLICYESFLCILQAVFHAIYS